MERFDVLICTALLEELEAVLGVFQSRAETWGEARTPGDERYHHCVLRGRAGVQLRVAAAWVGLGGVEQGAARLEGLLGQLKPQALVVCGVCAGRRDAVMLGDVVFADRVYRFDPDAPEKGPLPESFAPPAPWAMEARYLARQFDSRGEWALRRPLTMASQRAWVLRALEAQERGGPPPATHPDRQSRCPDWRDVIRALLDERQVEMVEGALSLTHEGRWRAQEEQILYVDGPPGDLPVAVHFGTLATVNRVMSSLDSFDRLRAIERKTIALDVEGAAFLEVAHRLDVSAIVVKGVGDFATVEREPRFRSFAAAISAEFAVNLLLQIGIGQAFRAAITPAPSAPADLLAGPWSTLDPQQRHVLAALAACARQTTVSAVAWVANADELTAEVSLATLVSLGLATLAPGAERPWSTPDRVRTFVREQPLGQRAIERHQAYAVKVLPTLPKALRWQEVEQDVPEVQAAVDDFEAAGKSLEAWQLFKGILEHEMRRGRYQSTAERIVRLLQSPPADMLELAEVTSSLVECYLVLGRAREAMTYAKNVSDGPDEVGIVGVPIQALVDIARCHEALGDFDSALAGYTDVLGTAVVLAADALHIRVQGALGALHVRRGDPETAAPLIDAAYARAMATGDPAAEVEQTANRALWLLAANRYSDAAEAYADVRDLAEYIGDLHRQAEAMSGLGVARMLGAPIMDNSEVIRRALAIHEQIGALPAQVIDRMRLGGSQLILGDMRQALVEWQAALDLADQAGFSAESREVVSLHRSLSGAGTYVTGALIQNVRSIDELAWEISRDAAPGWHVLIGDNGSGKSSFLRSIALALVSETEAHALRQDWNDWLRRGADHGLVSIDLARTFDQPEPSRRCVVFDVTLELRRQGDQAHLTDTSLKDLGRRIRDGSSPGLFSAAYGPFRRFSGGDSDYEKLFASLPRLARHLSLFDERPALTESIAWLKLLDHKKLEKDPEGEILDAIKAFINQADFLPHGTQLTKISSSAVTFTDGNGCEVGIEQLSDGHRSILSLTLELLRQLTVTYGPKKVFDPEDPTRVIAPGVVLIDEIDVHLHPTWQRSVGIWFTRHFPRIQFIVTSHSPLVCQAAEVGTVFLLPKPGTSGGRMLQGTELDRLRYGNVLDAYGTGVFGEDVTRSESGKQKLDRLAELNDAELDRDLEPEEIDERARLRAMFPTMAHARSGGGG